MRERTPLHATNMQGCPVGNPIRAMRISTRIVEMNSFTRATQTLGISRATATQIVQELETALGMPLLVYTTRVLRATPEGDAYYRRCVRITVDVDELEANIRDAALHPNKPLCIELPAAIADAVVLPVLDTFHARHPGLMLTLGASGHAADRVGDAIGCSVRLGELLDSSFVVRRLGILERMTCASPAYLDRHDVPHTLDDLASHHVVSLSSMLGQRVAGLDLLVDDTVREIRMDRIASVNDGLACLACDMHGLGLIQPPRVAAQSLIDAGWLCEVLPR